MAPTSAGGRRQLSMLAKGVAAGENNLKSIFNGLNETTMTTEQTFDSNMTKTDLHITIENTVFSDNVLGASPGADSTAIIYSVGASISMRHSVIVGTTRDMQKVEDLPHLVYMESAPIALHHNCFIGNDDGIAPVVAQHSTVHFGSNFNTRTTSQLSKSNCEFIAQNRTSLATEDFVCENSDASVCTANHTPEYRFPCTSYLDDIYFSESDVKDSTVQRTYVLCPDTVFRVGSRHDQDGTPLGGSYPIILGRSNIRVLCGANGSFDNGCEVINGVVQVAHFDEFGNNNGPIANALVQGISFSGASAINALVSGTGDVVFRDCVFRENSNVASVFVQLLDGKINGRRKLTSMLAELIEEKSRGRVMTSRRAADTESLLALFDSCTFKVSSSTLS